MVNYLGHWILMANVLLVDDNGSVLLTLAIALRRRGHIVTATSDARQALLHLKRQRFTFLVSDVRMPGMSGIELAAHAKSLPHPPRVILTSAYSNIEAREDIAEAFLRKPIDIQELHTLLSDQGTQDTAGTTNKSAAQKNSSARDSSARDSSATAQQASIAQASSKASARTGSTPAKAHSFDRATYSPALG